MAAIDLSASAPLPVVYHKTSVGTTLQAFILPARAKQVSVYGSAACWVQFTGTDGGAVSSTAKFPLAAASGAAWLLTSSPLTIFVAAQSGTADVSISVEGAS